MKIQLKHKDSGLLKEPKIGFSWTTLFFGLFVPLFRGSERGTNDDGLSSSFLKILIVPFIAMSLFVLTSCDNKKLTTKKAENLLKEYFSKYVRAINLDIGEIKDVVSERDLKRSNPCMEIFDIKWKGNNYINLEKQGFITITPVSKKYGAGFFGNLIELTCKIELSHKAEPYILETEDKSVSLKVGSRELIKIIKISEPAHTPRGVLSYVTYQYRLNPTPVGLAIGIKDELKEATAMFILYTDGWKVEEWDT
jgi:hypothetical protein